MRGWQRLELWNQRSIVLCELLFRKRTEELLRRKSFVCRMTLLWSTQRSKGILMSFSTINALHCLLKWFLLTIHELWSTLNLLMFWLWFIISHYHYFLILPHSEHNRRSIDRCSLPRVSYQTTRHQKSKLDERVIVNRATDVRRNPIIRSDQMNSEYALSYFPPMVFLLSMDPYMVRPY